MHVVVVGAGIAGLTAALEVRRRSPAAHVTLLEASDRVGGALRVAEVAGVSVDIGAESLLVRRPEALELARAVGLGDRLEAPAQTSASVWSRGRLRTLPGATVMGLPASIPAALRAAPLSLRERVATARGLLDYEAFEPGPDEDVSVGDYLRRRVGDPVVDRLVEPLLGGVYAGRVDELSLRATLPQLARGLRDRRTVLGAAGRARRQAAKRSGPVFNAPVGGVGQLPEAVLAELRHSGVHVVTRAPVQMLTRGERSWRVGYGTRGSSHAVQADAVVLAVPAGAAARLLSGPVPGAAWELRQVDYADVGIVTLAFDARDGSWAPGGSGLLVPAVEGRLVKAVTMTSRKWGWYSRQAPGTLVLRASVGRHRDAAALQMDDTELVARVREDLRDLVRIAAEPRDSLVTRWHQALPQYAVGHPSLVRRVRTAVAEHPGLALCGAAYDGVGIPAVIASAREAAHTALAGAGQAAPAH